MKRLALALPALALGIGFFAWPMASIVVTGLSGDPGRAWGVLTDPGIGSVAWFTVWQAAISTMLTLAVGLPLAFVLSRYTFPGRTVVRTLVTIPFVLPTVVVALAFISLIGPSGVLGIDLVGTAIAVIAAHVFFNVAVVVRTVGSLWGHLDPRLEHAAATLGASRWKAFRTVTLPLLRPAIMASAAVVFLFSFTSFGVVLFLGAPRLATIEVEIYRSAVRLFDLPTAASLSLLQLVAVTGALVAYSRIQERSGIEQPLLPRAAVARPPVGRERITVGAVAIAGAALAITPVAALAARVIRPSRSWGMDALAALGDLDPSLVAPWPAAGNSLWFGAVATVMALAAALPAAVIVARSRFGARWIDPLLMLPIGSSAVTLGFGFVVGLDAPVDLRSWWLLVPIAHALIAMPFVVRITEPVIRSIRPRLRAAAATLGAAPGRVWRTIDLPIISPAAAAAGALAFVVSLGEFGATLFVSRSGSGTLTLAIGRLIGRPGAANLDAAVALSLILVAVAAAVVAVLERTRVPGVGGF